MLYKWDQKIGAKRLEQTSSDELGINYDSLQKIVTNHHRSFTLLEQYLKNLVNSSNKRAHEICKVLATIYSQIDLERFINEIETIILRQIKFSASVE